MQLPTSDGGYGGVKTSTTRRKGNIRMAVLSTTILRVSPTEIPCAAR